MDATRPGSSDEAIGVLAAFHRAARLPLVVGVNRAATLGPAEEVRLRAALGLGPEVPVLRCDVADRGSVRSLLFALAYAAADRLASAA